MDKVSIAQVDFHGYTDVLKTLEGAKVSKSVETAYTFENFYHPFVGKLIEKLNSDSLSGMLDPDFQVSLSEKLVDSTDPNTFFTYSKGAYEPAGQDLAKVYGFSEEIDFCLGRAYANYNWELFFHVPLTVAVHLSKNQRFAEAQRWFHFIFDPTCNDTTIPTPQRYWKFLPFRAVDVIWKEKLYVFLNTRLLNPDQVKLKNSIINGDNRYFQAVHRSGGIIQHEKLMTLLGTIDSKHEILISSDWKILAFRKGGNVTQIDELMVILSKPESELKPEEAILRKMTRKGYEDIKKDPFQPHIVARTRQLAYQYSVVMKYLDNLIAWGDHLFQQDTIESINEATQRYVLAANILGARPQRIPPRGTTRPKTFATLKQQGLDPMGNALVELEGKFPHNLSLPTAKDANIDTAGPLFGIGRTLYFCIPRNDKLLGYWDTVADRLFKIRHCMNIEGVVRQLALFDPPIDPGMLVKAAAAGFDIGSIVNGLNQPASPVRAALLIQKALELCGEVRSLGSALLSAIEKGESEHIALLRLSHEKKIQEMQQDVRFLQWKQAEEATEVLLKGHAIALERYQFYQRLLGLPPNPDLVPDSFSIERSKKTDNQAKLSEETFESVYQTFVGNADNSGTYNKTPDIQSFPTLSIVGQTSPENQSGMSGQGRMYLNKNEDDELNSHLPRAKDTTLAGSSSNSIAAGFAPVPDPKVDLHFWGIGGSVSLKVGTALVAAAKIAGDILGIVAGHEREEAGMASKSASYDRRADEWMLQSNVAARELMHIGRQIIASLIAESIAHHEYLNVKKQIEHSEEVNRFLNEKFTNEKLYAWMQGEISRLYYEYYRFAFDTARKAEQTMKRELMRPEVDTTDYIKFNYWDSGRKGLLSGEALYLDLKRMEMAYHENNKREYELTKHVSLLQVNPLALLELRTTGRCTLSLPEALFDLDCPGHYLRRIKSVALSIPCVTGPYTSVNCTLTLVKSSIRKKPLLSDGSYQRADEDDRFQDYFGSVQSIVTSSAQNDSGMFEANLRDERYLPFENSGVISEWQLQLPANPAEGEPCQFDYSTISDVILHLRYTAREGGELLRSAALGRIQEIISDENASGLARLFSLKHDFQTEWHKFLNSTTGENFTATIKKSYFPFFVQGQDISFRKIELHIIQDGGLQSTTLDLDDAALDSLSATLNEQGRADLTVSENDGLVRDKQAQVFVIFHYSIQ
jgi:hypothetical protein